MTAAEINLLRDRCLKYASLTEAAGSDDKLPGQEKVVADVKNAIKSKDSGKIKTALVNFKKWYFDIEPNKKFEALNVFLNILPLLVSYAILGAGSIITGKLIDDEKIVMTVIAFIITIVAGMTPTIVYAKASNKYLSKDAKEKADKFTKEAEKLKKQLDKMSDKKSAEYKALLKLHETLLYCGFRYNSTKSVLVVNHGICID